jgi:hypothetical protein
MTATPPPASLRERLLAAIDDDAHRPWGQQQGLVNAMLAVVQDELAARNAENTRLRAELDAAQAAGMTKAATMLRRHCPHHSAGTYGTFLDCHCPAADEIDRDADALAARTPTS